MQQMDPQQAEQQRTERYINDLLRQYEENPGELDQTERTLLGKYLESRNRAQQIVSRADQVRKEIEVLNSQKAQLDSQLQQEVGKGAGVIDALLAVCPPPTMPAEPGPPPAVPNRKTRRAAAAKSRKGGNNAGKPKPDIAPVPSPEEVVEPS